MIVTEKPVSAGVNYSASKQYDVEIVVGATPGTLHKRRIRLPSADKMRQTMSARDQRATVNSNRSTAGCQRGVSTAQQLLIAALVCVVIAGVVVLTGIWPQEEPVISQPVPVAPTVPAPPAEETLPSTLPEPVLPAAIPPPEPTVEPLPSLFESDDPVRDALADIPLGTAGQQYLMPGNIIERSASLIYLTAQGDVPYKLVPIARPKAQFPIVDDGTQVVADPEGFTRYDPITRWIESLDAAELVDAFARFLPLLREAWGFYGEDPTYFDLAVIETLDTIIATPEIDVTEERLIRKEAVWIYENPAIESLAPIQKQVLRMGPRNAAAIKQQAIEARALWLAALAENDSV